MKCNGVGMIFGILVQFAYHEDGQYFLPD